MRLKISHPRFQRPFSLDKRKLVRGAAILGVLAVVLAVIGWKFIGAAPVALIALLGTGVLLVIGVKRFQRRQTEVIFGFYVTANEILGEDERRRRYHFEITEAIKTGEKVVSSMPDPPPLSSFALGALYDSIGNQNGAVQHLALAAEEELLKESPRVSASRQLKRYVKRLRQIERRPERWPKVNAAIRNLERMHQERAGHLLARNQVQLKRLVESLERGKLPELASAPSGIRISSNRSLGSIKTPPPISEVLNDIYQEENKAS